MADVSTVTLLGAKVLTSVTVGLVEPTELKVTLSELLKIFGEAPLSQLASIATFQFAFKPPPVHTRFLGT